MIKGGGGHKSSWIRQTTRLAVYLRDALACVYCGASALSVAISLDHVVPRVAGGSNQPDNLVTACKPCNEARRNRDDRAFARFLGLTVGEVARRQATQAAIPLTPHLREQARRLRHERPAWLCRLWALAANPGANAPDFSADLADVPF